MIKTDIYPDKLILDFAKSEKLIPRHLNIGEHLKIYHKYFIPEIGIVKVNDIDMINGYEYYFIKYGNKNGCITYPVDTTNVFEFLHNNNCIEEKDIINSKESFSGAEIKYWFAVNKLDNDIYNGFLSFVDYNSKNVIVDSKYYNIVYDKKRKQQFSISIDKNKSH